MAKLVVRVEDIITVLKANGWVSRKVSDIQPVDGGVSFKVDTGVPFVGAAKVQVNYVGYDGRWAELELARGGLLDKLSGFIPQAVKLPSYVRFEYPRILVDIEQVVGSRVRGLAIEGIELEGDSLAITASATGVDSPTERSQEQL